jgi:hypothetical protein
VAFKNEEYTKSMEGILDCFTGADGGGSFMALKVSLENMEDEFMRTKNPKAKELLDIFVRFNRLIEAFNRRTFL